MPYTIDDVVDYIMGGNIDDLNKAVDEIMSDKVNDALELRMQHIGQEIFSPESTEPEEVETNDGQE